MDIFNIILTLITPLVVSAKIKVTVTSSENEKDRDVKLCGKDEHVITEDERMAFKLIDENLKKAVKTHLGKKPDSVYLKDPTPWGDLYKQHDWKPVTRVLEPKQSTFMSIQSSPTLVLTQIFNNTSTKTATFKTTIRQDVQNIVSSSWYKNGELRYVQNIDYNLNLLSTSFTGNLDFHYASKWGESVVKSEVSTVGTESAVEIVLEPNQTLCADLIATRDVIKLQVFYEASIYGSVFANYDEPYEGHHFWALDLNTLLKDAGMLKTVKSSEVITLDYYSRSKVEIRDMLYSGADYYSIE